MRPGIFSVLLLGLTIRNARRARRSKLVGNFALTWYATFGGAVLSALIALVSAVVERDATIGRRLGAIALGLPVLLAAAAFIALISTFARLAA